ncbi:hypothetical protein O0L34_g8355 [Tuta absoluta]|nr:hypothetical protein O0L34_g8355 [Tuta absoluta]
MKVTSAFFVLTFAFLSAEGIKWRSPVGSCVIHRCEEDYECQGVVRPPGMGSYAGCYLLEDSPYFVPEIDVHGLIPPYCCLFPIVPETEEYWKRSHHISY